MWIIACVISVSLVNSLCEKPIWIEYLDDQHREECEMMAKQLAKQNTTRKEFVVFCSDKKET